MQCVGLTVTLLLPRAARQQAKRKEAKCTGVESEPKQPSTTHRQTISNTKARKEDVAGQSGHLPEGPRGEETPKTAANESNAVNIRGKGVSKQTFDIYIHHNR